MIKFSPSNWPVNAPDYWSREGYEYQQLLTRKALIAEVNTIPWLIKQKSFLHLQIAARLAEIVDHPLAAHYRKICDALESARDAGKRTVGNYKPIVWSETGKERALPPGWKIVSGGETRKA